MNLDLSSLSKTIIETSSELSEDLLLKLNEIGLIPGPNESAAAFLKRATYSLSLKDHLPKELAVNFSDQDCFEKEIVSKAAEKVKIFYGCAPLWTLLFFSNEKLSFWHGGCAWIFQMDEQSPTSAIIQLRNAFKISSSYLNIYDREELLTHELCHVGRLMFDEPKFEEILAYQTAQSSFRRFLGPLAGSSKENAIFLLTLFILTVFDIFLLSLHHYEAYTLTLWLKLIPLIMIGSAFFRLKKRHATFASCKKNLENLVGEEQAKSVIYRLTDEEITYFSKNSKDTINAYIHEKIKTELRWQLLFKRYFSF